MSADKTRTVVRLTVGEMIAIRGTAAATAAKYQGRLDRGVGDETMATALKHQIADLTSVVRKIEAADPDIVRILGSEQ